MHWNGTDIGTSFFKLIFRYRVDISDNHRKTLKLIYLQFSSEKEAYAFFNYFGSENMVTLVMPKVSLCL